MRQITYDNRIIPAAARGGLCLNLNTRRAAPNSYNRCLNRELAYWEAIRSGGGLEKFCCPSKYLQEPWLKMPSTGRRFQKISSIALPAMTGLDNVVVSFTVPVGYDGVIQQMVNFWTGIGFEEGSGQLTWRIKNNNRWIKDYGQILTTLGSLATPYTVFQGPVRIASKQTITYYVNNALASGLLGGRAVCALLGWFYPR